MRIRVDVSCQGQCLWACEGHQMYVEVDLDTPYSVHMTGLVVLALHSLHSAGDTSQLQL